MPPRLHKERHERVDEDQNGSGEEQGHKRLVKHVVAELHGPEVADGDAKGSVVDDDVGHFESKEEVAGGVLVFALVVDAEARGV